MIGEQQKVKLFTKTQCFFRSLEIFRDNDSQQSNGHCKKTELFLKKRSKNDLSEGPALDDAYRM